MPTPVRTLREAWPQLAELWSDENELSADEITMGTPGDFRWFNPECEHTFTMSLKNRVKKRDKDVCPVCAGRVVQEGFNDLMSQNPEVAAEWDFSKNDLTPDKVTIKSGRRAFWICGTCQHAWDATIANRTNGHGCPKCGYLLRGESSRSSAVERSGPLSDARPDLVAEWDPRNELTPGEVSEGSKYRARWMCQSGHTWVASVVDRMRYGCPSCPVTRSRGERELTEYVESLGFEPVISDRSVLRGKELDILVPSRGVAFEFNGLYWHSDRFVDAKAHWAKSVTAEAARVQLIHIWEDDWRERKGVVKAMVARKLGASPERRMNARALSAGFVSAAVAREFLESHHVQGFASGREYLALSDASGAVALMVMRLRKTGEWELVRYATSAVVRGGFSKLFSAFLRNHPEAQSVVSFSDRGVSDGGLYEAMGFVRDGEVAPDYSYLVKDTRVHKFNYRKARFERDPELKFQSGLTEKELADLNGIARIYDAGKIRWRYSISSSSTSSTSSISLN